MFASLIAALAGFAQPAFADDAEQYSVWMQQACRVQQVGHGGGEPVDHTEFCACFDSHVREMAPDEAYRALALGSQGAVQEQGLIEDWQAARDTAASEAAAMAPEVQATFTSILRDSLLACIPLSYQGG